MPATLLGGALREDRPPIRSEKALADLWERSLELRPRLVGKDGAAYEIIFPGIRNHGAGPDFKGAVLSLNGRTIGGDVELHLHSGGWRAHGHHRDPEYRGVALHVALTVSARHADAFPPTVEARFAPDAAPAASPDVPDLRLLGSRRFFAKSAGFRLEMESGADPDQLVYAALLEAMGYGRNRKPFRALAERVPLSRFAALSEEPRASAEFAALACLIVGGGLLDDADTHERRQMLRIARRLGVRRRLSPSDWSRFRVRPANAPATRLRGVAALIAESLRSGPMRAFERALETEGERGVIRRIERRPHIGRGAAVAAAAGAALPALHAFAARGDAERRGMVEEAFRRLPAPPSDSVVRGVSAALGIRARPKLAVEHFGLHELARASSWHGGASPVSG